MGKYSKFTSLTFKICIFQYILQYATTFSVCDLAPFIYISRSCYYYQ